MSLLNAIVALSYLGCITCFSWAMRRFFVRRNPTLSFEQSLIVYLGGGFAIVQAASLVVSELRPGAPVGIAFGLLALSMTVFWSAIRANRAHPLTWAFELDQPVHLVREGPNRWVRHTFYVSYTLCWLAPPVATLSAWLSLPALAMGTLYWCSATAEERRFLASPLGNEYRTYQARTGMFWPALWSRCG